MKAFLLLSTFLIIGCRPDAKTQIEPEGFLAEHIPKNQLAHGGVLSPNGKQFYVTLSDTLFQNFEVMVSQKKNDQWQPLEPAFFNSEFDEHGVSFSPNENQLYFSSTRPTGIDSIPQTWHIWRSTKSTDGWGKPEFINIPSMSQNLVSHPSLTQSGRMYFHAGEVDYSNLTIYYSDQVDGQFSIPKQVSFEGGLNGPTITPYVGATESYLLFGHVQDGQEAMYYSQNRNGNWQKPIRLPDVVNTNNKANPHVSADSDHLYYASGEFTETGVPRRWIIKRIKWKGLSDCLRLNKN
ncbi:MAG: hypothetical protein R8N23_01005 [Reichenbachiella sp.]|uniref:hypothetical protein n=1 Tax=Reichenbachiella sp. TaxID=2184521 RepID=UPI00296698B0|nr:hypothetical protein [Reichenbachiella sp.]MDW3208414.1 hypothetical protein [Reichenbachiella sp.]